jgi:hypothetical protein
MYQRSKAMYDDFTRQYIETALWAENDNSTPSGGEPLDKNYGIGDLAPETIAKMTEDGKAFLAAVQTELPFVIEECEGSQLGHDFWLTRNGHGAGFWDGDYDWMLREYEMDVGEKLTEIAKRFKECNLYPGDDGKIYIM